jgi:drug/metabolite transporter (DMT)-like permease
MVARSIVALCFILPLLFFSKPKAPFIEKIKTSKFALHFIRGLGGFLGVFIYFYILRDLSLTIATLLFFSVPLFMPFVGYVWKRHPMPKLDWIAIVIGFIGVLFVIKPGHQLFHPSAVIGLLSGLTLAIGQFAVHLLAKTDSNARINFYYFFIAFIIALPLTFLTREKSWSSLYAIDYFYLFWIGILALIYALLLSLALKLSNPSLVTTFLYTAVIFTMLIDWFVWKIIAHLLTWIGTILIVIGSALKYYLHKGENHPDT